MPQSAEPQRVPPILAGKEFTAPSVFEPANLLREARRQKNVPEIAVPEICILDPDGDILRALQREGHAQRSPGWACYHTELYEFDHGGGRFGIIGCAVGSSFAVLLAEELFVSGCRLLISMTSAGQILVRGPTPYFVVIDRALRDEGTSYHYLPPAEFAEADGALVMTAMQALRDVPHQTHRGATWTTDAPFRETAPAIEQARCRGILAVEMEAAALYAFAQARQKPVLCLAHVTNRMAVDGGDFEKGEAEGAYASLAVIAAIARAWREQTGGRAALTAERSAVCAIAVMAKAPRTGDAKTRLVPPLSAAEAAELSGCFILDAAENIAAAAQHAAIDGHIAYSPAEAEDEFVPLLAAGTRLLPSRRPGLAASLHDAATDLLRAGYGSVCLVNSDSPTLPTSLLVDAARALSLPSDRVVLGPAEDGGYYLIGLKQAHARLFEDIAWSTPLVFAQTVERAREIGLDPIVLPVWYDVDDIAALQRLYAELRDTDDTHNPGAAYRAAHTAAFLRQLFRDDGEPRLRLGPTGRSAGRAGP